MVKQIKTFFSPVLYSTIAGQTFAAVCCTKLRINSSLRLPTWLSRYNTFNGTATDLSGLYRAIKGSHTKGKCKNSMKQKAPLQFLNHFFADETLS